MADEKDDFDFEADEVDSGEMKKLKLDSGDDDELHQRVNDIQAKIAAAPSAELYANLGNAYFQLEQDTDALAAFTKAIELDGSKATYYEQKAQVHLYANDTEQALALLQKALTLDPTNAAVLFDLGKAYQIDEDHANALKYFRMAVDQDANHAKALYQVASYVLNDAENKDVEQRQEQALALFKKVIAVDPKYTNAYYNAGQILQARCKSADDIKEAAGLFSKAVALDPTDAQLRAKLIQCYDHLDNDSDRESARTALHAAYKKGSLNPSYTALGRYCCGLFDVGTKCVMAFDHFKLDASNPVKYAFLVYNKGEVHDDKVLYRISLSNSGSWQLVNDKTGKLADFADEPHYKDVKAKVVAAINSA